MTSLFSKPLQHLVEKYPELQVCLPDLNLALSLLAGSFSAGHKLLVCGNGGSAADSEHIVGELMKGYLQTRPIPDEARKKLLDAAGDDGIYLADHLQGALPAISLVKSRGVEHRVCQ